MAWREARIGARPICRRYTFALAEHSRALCCGQKEAAGMYTVSRAAAGGGGRGPATANRRGTGDATRAFPCGKWNGKSTRA
eukprot:scaffold26193_cov144-Isochrysis_galbana.AAC.2